MDKLVISIEKEERHPEEGEDFVIGMLEWEENNEVPFSAQIEFELMSSCLSPQVLTQLVMNYFGEMVGTQEIGLKEEPGLGADMNKMWAFDTIPETQKQYVSKWMKLIIPEWKRGVEEP